MSWSMNHKIDPVKLRQSTPSDALPLSFFGGRAYPQGMLPLAPGLMPYCIPCCFVWARSPFCVLNLSLALWDPHSSCFSFSRPTRQGLPLFVVLYLRLSGDFAFHAYCLWLPSWSSQLWTMQSFTALPPTWPHLYLTLEETADEWT